MPQPLIITTTTDSREAAEKIAAQLVERRLAACVQIAGPIGSVYRWEGKVESAQEWICSAKTLDSHFETVATAIRELHSYEEPEIIGTPICASSPSYLAWLQREVS